MKKSRERAQIERISHQWKKRLTNRKEYDLVEDSTALPKTVISSKVWEDDYTKAVRVKRALMKQHKNRSFLDVFQGEEIQTPEGPCFVLSDQEPVTFQKPDLQEALNECNARLQLLQGIGPKTERKLKREGWHTVHDLAEHPRFGPDAEKLLTDLENQNIQDIAARVDRFFPKSHPIALYLAGFQDIEDFLFFDLETMGLFGRPIILFGVASISDDQIHTRQYLLRTIPEEPAGLLATIANVTEKTAFVSYNGRAFDVPYFRDRLNYYQLEHELEGLHFDLLHFARRAWKGTLPDFKLGTLEALILGLDREMDLPSALVPEFYEEYLRTKNPGSLIPIVEHNKQDLVSLASIFSKLRGCFQE